MTGFWHIAATDKRHKRTLAPFFPIGARPKSFGVFCKGLELLYLKLSWKQISLHICLTIYMHYKDANATSHLRVSFLCTKDWRSLGLRLSTSWTRLEISNLYHSTSVVSCCYKNHTMLSTPNLEDATTPTLESQSSHDIPHPQLDLSQSVIWQAVLLTSETIEVSPGM